MSITIEVPPILQQHTQGEQTVSVEGNTVDECLSQLLKKYPGVKAALFDESNKLHGYIQIFINSASTYPQELSKPVIEGDVIDILFLISGG